VRPLPFMAPGRARSGGSYWPAPPVTGPDLSRRVRRADRRRDRGQRGKPSRLVEHLMHAADREFLVGYRVQADRADQNDACPDRVDQAGPLVG
jgi:hypothetical protein